MSSLKKITQAIAEAKTGKYKITDKKTGNIYKYGEDLYMDTQIINCCFADMFPDKTENAINFHGFNRDNYILSQRSD